MDCYTFCCALQKKMLVHAVIYSFSPEKTNSNILGFTDHNMRAGLSIKYKVPVS